MIVAAGKISEIEEGKPKVVEIDGRPVVIFKVGGEYKAMDNTCPHRGAPLNEGYVEGETLTCPWHAWQFNLKTGQCLTVPSTRQRQYAVRVQGDEISLEIAS